MRGSGGTGFSCILKGTQKFKAEGNIQRMDKSKALNTTAKKTPPPEVPEPESLGPPPPPPVSISSECENESAKNILGVIVS